MEGYLYNIYVGLWISAAVFFGWGVAFIIMSTQGIHGVRFLLRWWISPRTRYYHSPAYRPPDGWSVMVSTAAALATACFAIAACLLSTSAILIAVGAGH